MMQTCYVGVGASVHLLRSAPSIWVRTQQRTPTTLYIHNYIYIYTVHVAFFVTTGQES